MLPGRAMAYAELKPFEFAFGNAIARWTGRISAIGTPANDNAVRIAVASELSWAGRAAPFLRVAGRYLGPVSAGLGLIAVLSVVTSDEYRASVTKYVSGLTGLTSYDQVIDALGIGGAGLVEQADHSFRTFWATAESYGYDLGKYLDKGWQFLHQRNSPEPAEGKKAILWEKPGNADPQPHTPPAEDFDAAKQKLAAMPPGTAIKPEDAAELVNKVLAKAREGLPEAQREGFPDPVAHPVTPADIDPQKWTVPVLAGDTAGYRDVDLGNDPATDADPDPTTDPGPNLGTPPVKSPIPTLGDLPWPDWHLADPPAVANVCADPSVTMGFSGLSWPGGATLSDYHVTATGYCAAGRSMAVFTRPFVLAVVTLGCVISALTNKE